MLGVQPIARERNGDGWLLSILATVDLSGRRRATPKLALGRTPVKAVRVRRAKRPAGGALDGSTRAMEPLPRQIDGAAPMVKVAEEKGSAALPVLARGKTRLTVLAVCLTSAKVHRTVAATQGADAVATAVVASWRAAG
jgi:hypothetical protein